MNQETIKEILNTLKSIEERLGRIEDLVDPDKTFERFAQKNIEAMEQAGRSPIRV